MKIIRDVSENIWNEVAQNCPHATFFHTPNWSKIITQTYSRTCSNATQAFDFGNGRLVILPFIRSDFELKKNFSGLHSSVFGLYGGPIYASPVSAGRLESSIHATLKAGIKKISFNGNPHCIDFFDTGKQVDRFTQAIELEKTASEAALFDSYSDSVVRMIKKGSSQGFVFCRAQNIQEVEQFHAIYQDAIRRWGDKATNNYEIDLFRSIFLNGGDVWVVKKDENIVAGNINYYFNGISIDWLHACDPQYMKAGLSHYFTHQLIDHYRKVGARIYDFNPSGGHEGVVQFKASFGATKKYFKSFSIDNEGCAYKTYAAIRGLFEKVSVQCLVTAKLLQNLEAFHQY